VLLAARVAMARRRVCVAGSAAGVAQGQPKPILLIRYRFGGYVVNSNIFIYD